MKAVLLALSWIILSSGVIMTSIAGIAFVGFPNAEDGENAIQQEVVSGSSLEPVRIDNEGAGLAAVMEAGDARAQLWPIS